MFTLAAQHLVKLLWKQKNTSIEMKKRWWIWNFTDKTESLKPSRMENMQSTSILVEKSARLSMNLRTCQALKLESAHIICSSRILPMKQMNAKAWKTRLVLKSTSANGTILMEIVKILKIGNQPGMVIKPAINWHMVMPKQKQPVKTVSSRKVRRSGLELNIAIRKITAVPAEKERRQAWSLSYQSRVMETAHMFHLRVAMPWP